MSHRVPAGIHLPAEPDSKEATVEENSHNPGLGYLSTEMPTWRELPLSIPSRFSSYGSSHPALDRNCIGSHDELAG